MINLRLHSTLDDFHFIQSAHLLHQGLLRWGEDADCAIIIGGAALCRSRVSATRSNFFLETRPLTFPSLPVSCNPSPSCHTTTALTPSKHHLLLSNAHLLIFVYLLTRTTLKRAKNSASCLQPSLEPPFLDASSSVHRQQNENDVASLRQFAISHLMNDPCRGQGLAHLFVSLELDYISWSSREQNTFIT